MNYLEAKKCSKNPGIYLIQNNINGKPYVGQAIKLRKRLLQHINHKEEDYPLYRAFHKYGIENFTFSILEELEVGDKNYNDIKKIQIDQKSFIQISSTLIEMGIIKRQEGMEEFQDIK